MFESSRSKHPFLTWTVPRSFTFVPGGVLRLKTATTKRLNHVIPKQHKLYLKDDFHTLKLKKTLLIALSK